MLVASELLMADVQDFENVVTAVSDVSCNIVQLRYAVFFFWGGGDRCRGRTISMILMVFRFCRVSLCDSVVTSIVRVMKFLDRIDLGFWPSNLQRNFSRSHDVNCLFDSHSFHN